MSDFISVTWTAGDIITESKMDSMVSNDTAEDAHPSLKLTEIAEPATPAANKLALYAKDKSGVSALFFKDDGGTEHELSGEAALEFIIDGGGSAITTGQKGHLEVPFNCIVNGWTVVADVAGAIVVDIWKDTYANFPPTVADTIAGSELPTLVATNQKNQDLSLTTWTIALTKGDIIAFNVNSITTCQRVNISLRVTKT